MIKFLNSSLIYPSFSYLFALCLGFSINKKRAGQMSRGVLCIPSDSHFGDSALRRPIRLLQSFLDSLSKHFQSIHTLILYLNLSLAGTTKFACPFSSPFPTLQNAAKSSRKGAYYSLLQHDAKCKHKYWFRPTWCRWREGWTSVRFCFLQHLLQRGFTLRNLIHFLCVYKLVLSNYLVTIPIFWSKEAKTFS